jgi:hypothetical protein
MEDAYLAVIAFPDSHVTRCGFSTKGLNIGKRKIGNSLPNIANNSIKPLKLNDVAKIFPSRTVVVCPNTAVRLKGRYGRLSVTGNDSNAHRIKGSTDYYFKTSVPGTYHYSKFVEIKGGTCWQDTIYSENLTIIVRADIQEPCLKVSRPENKVQERINIYPNPTSDHLTIHFGTGTPAHIQVMDMKGVVIYQSDSQSESTEINLSDWNEGVYLLCINCNGQIYREKLLIVR